MSEIQKKIERCVRSCDWNYEHAGTDWRDGLFTGNGNLGVLASAPSHLEWLINSNEVFDALTGDSFRLPHRETMRIFREERHKNSYFLEKYENGKQAANVTVTPAILQMHFGPVGWAAPSAPLVSQRLRLYEGMLYTSFRAHTRNGCIRSFTPRGHRLFCMHLNLDEPFARHVHTLYLFRPDCMRFAQPEWLGAGENTIAFTQKMFEGDNASFAVAMKVVPANNTRLRASGEGPFRSLSVQGEFDLFLSVFSSHYSADPLAAARSEVERGAETGFETLAAENGAWWRDYWNRCYAEFSGEKELQRYFTFSLYEIGAVFGEVPMPGLNGLAYGPTNSFIYGSNVQGYTHDQNLQIPFLPFLPMNRTEFTESLADTYLAATDTLKSHTRELFGCDGIFLPLCSNQLGGDLLQGVYRYTLCGSAYVGMVLALAWRFSHDERLYREKYYPLLKAFTEFYMGIMPFSGEDGKYHLDWSIPPEIYTMTRDDTATLAMLRTVLDVIIEAAVLYGMDEPFRAKCTDLVAHYPDLARHSTGSWWCGPDIPDNHSMFGGHMTYPFFPAESYPDTEIAEKTLEYYDKFAIERACEGVDGSLIPSYDWSWFNSVVTRQRLGHTAETWNELKRHIPDYAKENGFFTHCPVIIADPETTEKNIKTAPFVERMNWRGEIHGLDFAGGLSTPNPNAKRVAPSVVEGNSIFLFAAAESLLQSWGGVIRLFPGVPKDFSGWFHRMLAQGAFEVSAEMKNGRLADFRITSLAGGTCRLLDPRGSGKIITRTLAKGESFRFKELE